VASKKSGAKFQNLGITVAWVNTR